MDKINDFIENWLQSSSNQDKIDKAMEQYESIIQLLGVQETSWGEDFLEKPTREGIVKFIELISAFSADVNLLTQLSSQPLEL